MPDAAHPLESPESSSPIVTRAVAAALRGEYSDAYTFPMWQKIMLHALGMLPQAAARFAISRFERLSGLPPGRLAGLTVEKLARERLQDYSGLSGPFPAITLGAPLGGASAHISLALRGPFLPQTFVTTIKGGAPKGDAQQYFQRSAQTAFEIAQNNPNLLTIQHYDPVHDGWMTRFVNHLRFKLLDLPAAYADYIRQHLAPGGTVCYLDCQAQWLRYQVGERSIFQVGGWGDISPQEFIEGSERLARYARESGFHQNGWRLEGRPLTWGPESEWGSEPGLRQALEAFCEREGFEFAPMTLPHPHDFSHLAFSAVRHLLEKEGREPAGVLVEMFSQFDATAVQRSGLLPLWLVFNTRDSLAFLKSMRRLFPPEKPVFFSPLATFTQTPDIVPWNEWEQALQDFDWRSAGARPSHYPADARALVTWTRPLRSWVERNARPIRSKMDAAELAQIAAGIHSLSA